MREGVGFTAAVLCDQLLARRGLEERRNEQPLRRRVRRRELGDERLESRGPRAHARSRTENRIERVGLAAAKHLPDAIVVPELTTDLTAREVTGAGIDPVHTVVRVHVDVRISRRDGGEKIRHWMAGQRADEIRRGERTMRE